MKKVLNIYDPGADMLVNDVLKLYTLRIPDEEKYPFKPGDETIAHCPQSAIKEIPIVFFSSQVMVLKLMDPAILLLDGFPTAEIAAEGLSSGGFGENYDKITVKSNLLGLGFISKARYETLSQEAKKVLLSEPFGVSVRSPLLHEIFLPALFWWFDRRFSRFQLSEWHRFLSTHKFFSGKYLEEVEERVMERYGPMDSADFAVVFDLEPEDDFYQAIVLARLVDATE